MAFESWGALYDGLREGRWRAVAWDFDGVLHDSDPLFREVVVQECRDMGLVAAAEAAEVGQLSGRETSQIVEELMVGADREQVDDLLGRVVRRYEAEAAEQLSIDDDASELVHDLAHDGVRQCVVSNGRAGYIHGAIRRCGLEHVLRDVVTPSGSLRPKPSPDLYVEALRALGATSATCVAVEDSDVGARAANGAGLTVLRMSVYGRDT